MNDTDAEQVRAIRERIANILVALNSYRVRHSNNREIESVMEQLELIRDYLETGKHLNVTQKEAFNFNVVAGTPLEDDEHLATELQSIRNFAAHSM